MTSADFDLNAGYQMLANLAAATEPAARIDGAQWNPLTIPMMPDARGQTLTIGRTIQFDVTGPIFAYAAGSRIGPFDTHEQARAAIEKRVVEAFGSLLTISGSALVASDLLAALKRANEFIRNGVALGFIRMPDAGTPDPAKETPRIVAEAIEQAEGRGFRAQSFEDRERELLAANARFEQEARDAKAKLVAISAVLDRELARNVATDVPLRRVKHLKRGSTYEVLGEAEAQVAVDASGEPFGLGQIRARSLAEGAKLTVYRCEETGKLWARFSDEFADGRFEDIAEERAA